MSKRAGPNKENYEETRSLFLEKAMEEFCAQGYINASTTRIVENSGMARGSLYYHFGDKYGLFEAIYISLMERALTELSEAMDGCHEPWEALKAGCKRFLELCAEDDFRKIVLLESQSAMSFGNRIAIVQSTLIKKLNEVMLPLLNEGYFKGHNQETASVFVMGYLAEIGRSLEFSEDVDQAREMHAHALMATLENLRPYS